VEDVREEVQHMSSLVNELLSFSKAGLRQKAIKVEPVSLSVIVKRVIDRETTESDKIEINVPEICRLWVRANCSRAHWPTSFATPSVMPVTQGYFHFCLHE